MSRFFDDRDQWAEDHGYQRYHCRWHGSFWSDTGPHCEVCREPEEENGEATPTGREDEL